MLCHLGHCVVWEWIIVGTRMEARSLTGDFSCQIIRQQKLRKDDGCAYGEKCLDLTFFFHVKGEGNKRRN